MPLGQRSGFPKFCVPSIVLNDNYGNSQQILNSNSGHCPKYCSWILLIPIAALLLFGH